MKFDSAGIRSNNANEASRLFDRNISILLAQFIKQYTPYRWIKLEPGYKGREY